MISQIRGTLIEKTPTEIVVDCHGVGYGLSISMNTYSALPDIEQSVRLYTVLVPRETELQLYGFNDKPERETFFMLTAISGIGPKTALGILSSVTIQELQQAILKGDVRFLNQLHGVGKKMAERLLVELRDKIHSISGLSLEGAETDIAQPASALQYDAIAALIALGYQKAAAEKSVKHVMSILTDTPTVDMIIKRALSELRTS
ncbi:MAG: Holliday junction branch migration protein RuvA [bacterium]